MERQSMKEDRISGLPDSIIHHILSLLPSTKESIRTSVLSKRWHKQWIHVPVLIFHSTSMSYQNFLQFVHNTLILHSCSKIKKFHLQYHYWPQNCTQLIETIRFAIRKNVDELSLSMFSQESLPEFIFCNDSLVELRTEYCTFMPNGNVNWGSLTALNMRDCKLPDQGLKHILSGSPSLKSLELIDSFFGLKKLVIASKSLKRLFLIYRHVVIVSDIEISCPNLEEVSLCMSTCTDPGLFAQAIANVLSSCTLLESFQLSICEVLDKLVISSNSVKRLVLGYLRSVNDIKISCPNLENLKLFGCLNIDTAKFLDLPTSLCAAAIEFYHPMVYESSANDLRTNGFFRSLIKDILQQFHHVKKLRIGNWFIKVLSDWETLGPLSLPVLNVKCLALVDLDMNYHNSGIACVLRNSPVLEKLVINNVQGYYDRRKPNGSVVNYWNLDANVLASHLKTIKIIGLPERDDKRKLVLNFVGFLLKNARVPEKMIIIIFEDHATTTDHDGKCFPYKVSQELLSLPRCSQNAVIELLSSK